MPSPSETPKRTRHDFILAATWAVLVWLIVAWVIFGVAWANVEIQEELTLNGVNYFSVCQQGWPLVHCEFKRVGNVFRGGKVEVQDIKWHELAQKINAGCGVLVTLAVAACGLRWQRRADPKISLSGLFVLLTIVAGWSALYRQGIFSSLRWHSLGPQLLGSAAVMFWICWGWGYLFLRKAKWIAALSQRAKASSEISKQRDSVGSVG